MRGGRLRRRLAAQRERRAQRGGRALALGVDAQQGRAGVDLAVRHRQHLADDAGGRRGHRQLDLHRLDAGDRLARGHALSGHHRQRHHHAGQRGGDHAARVAGDEVRDPVHVHQVADAVHRREHARAPAAPGQAALAAGQAIDLHVHRRGARRRDPVRVRSGLAHLQPVSLAGVEQLHRAARRGADPRPPAARLGQEARALQVQLQLVRLQRGGEQRHLGAGRDQPLARGGEAGQEAHAGRPGAHLGAGQQRQQPGLARAAPARQRVGVRERLGEAPQGAAAVGAEGDDGGDGLGAAARLVALLDGGLGVHVGVGGQPQPLQPPGRGRRLRRLGIARQEPGRDAVAARRRQRAERRAGGEPDRLPDQVHPGGGLDRRGRPREGVHAGERQPARGRVEQQLHAGDPHPAGRRRDREPEHAGARVLLGAERRRGGLGQHRHVREPQRGVAHADGLRLAVPVPRHHDLEQPRRGVGRAGGGERHAHLVRDRGEPLRRAHALEHRGGRAEEQHAELLAGLGEGGPLRQRRGAEPGGLGAGHVQRQLRRPLHLHRGVGVADERQAPVARGVDRHRERRLPLARQLADGAHRAPARLAPIQHRHPPQRHRLRHAPLLAPAAPEGPGAARDGAATARGPPRTSAAGRIAHSGPRRGRSVRARRTGWAAGRSPAGVRTCAGPGRRPRRSAGATGARCRRAVGASGRRTAPAGSAPGRGS
ncbi:hypothetical protein PSR1_02452 [Anaeromyxobacter sp. PSR-1]|nr:hypothetical protein PSR1_02452 [Anaeromyxobacter sp. PSR-1]